MKKLNFKAFTLVEMLIVIVIIGILIAALLPRLQGAQGRARDVARKNSLNQIATAIIAYQNDKGKLPATGSGVVTVQSFSGTLEAGGIITSVPKDPQVTNVTILEGDTAWGYTYTAKSGTGDFMYMVRDRNGVQNVGFVLATAVESEGNANWIRGTAVSGDVRNINPCLTVSKGSPKAFVAWGDCTYENNEELMFIYVY